ncbi:MAG: C45 family autoproteolytic acyltransferase/hydrolase [Verrucomicrobiia bacterium]
MKTLRTFFIASCLAAATVAQQPNRAASPFTKTGVTKANQLAIAPRPAALNAEQREWLAKGERHEKGGWIYLHVEGGPRERGFQHGYLLANEIGEGLRVRRTVWYHNTAMDWGDLLKETARFMTPFIDVENREELLGIVDGLQAAGIAATLDDLVAYNAYMELEWYWWPEVKKKLDGSATAVTSPKQSCSSFIATGSMTRGGGVVLGHNTMWDYVEASFNIIIDLLPTNGHRLLMQTAPGWIHSGTDFFITAAGLVGSETTIGGFHGFTEWGIPEFVRMRRATQDAANIDEWCTIMKQGNNGGYANAWLLGDVNTGEIARLELGLAHVGFERTRDGFFTGSNVAENRKILVRETDMNDGDIRDSCIARRVRWKQLMAQHRGRIDATLGRDFLADHFDVYAKADRPGGRTLCGHTEIETAFAPGAAGLWNLPFGHNGTVDAKVVDTAMAKRMAFAARWGSACGRAFDAKKYLQDHPQFDWLEGLLKDLPSEAWVEFTAGEKP